MTPNEDVQEMAHHMAIQLQRQSHCDKCGSRLPYHEILLETRCCNCRAEEDLDEKEVKLLRLSRHTLEQRVARLERRLLNLE